MNLKLSDNNFSQYPYLSEPIPDVLMDFLDIRYFDKDGYEITTLMEQAFYKHNGVDLGNEIQRHTSTAVEWFYDDTPTEVGLILDHSMIMTRWSFTGAAREQLERHLPKRPILNKLLQIKPKWGIDFSLDWVDTKETLEIIHVEQDFDTYEEAIVHKRTFEQLVLSTDWEESVSELLQLKPQWIGLNSDDQSDFKAQFFGWHRAFNNLKVI